MPVTHFVCDVDQKQAPIATCLNCAARMLKRKDGQGRMRHCDIPYPIIHAAATANDNRKDAGISVTMLVGCLRKTWYDQVIDTAIPIRSTWAANHGNAVHEYMAKHAADLPNATPETRFYKTLANGVILSGQMDLIRWNIFDEETQTWYAMLEDYKTKEELFEDAPREYQIQLLIYQWMLMTGCYMKLVDARPDDPMSFVQAKYPFTHLRLHPINHKDVSTVEVPPLQLEQLPKLEAWLIAQTDALQLVLPSEVPRIHSNPAKAPFCQKICPFMDICTAHGGKHAGRITFLQGRNEQAS